MLLETLRDVAARDAARPAVIGPDGALTYGELVTRSEAVAGGLLTRGHERVGCASEDPLTAIVLLAAASAAGIEICIYPRGLDAEGIGRFARLLGHETVVVDRPLDLDGVDTVAPDDLVTTPRTIASPSASPLLILTTGTAGTPKGVRHDWRRLIAAVRRGPDGAGDRWLLAYNLNQFAGIQVLLHALVHGAAVVVPRTSQSRDALDSMRRHGVTHVSATPTFWRLLAGEQAASGPPPPLRQITLGGEATPDGLIERLAAIFPDARISHVYAGTEFGSAVAVGDRQSGLPRSILDRDEDADVRFRVVDGELHVWSRHAMLGYHGGDAHDGWIATGDLVEERDGRLHFVGRTVEIINVGGAKVHPLPIEERVGAVDGVLIASVFGAPNAITGQIVAVDVVPVPGADRDEVTAAIHAACADLPGPGRPRRIRFVEELATLGNKVIRRPTEV